MIAHPFQLVFGHYCAVSFCGVVFVAGGFNVGAGVLVGTLVG